MLPDFLIRLAEFKREEESKWERERRKNGCLGTLYLPGYITDI
jgi:hypothetical protein